MKTFVHISPLKGNRKEIRNLIDYIVGLPQDTSCYVQGLDRNGEEVWCLYPGDWMYRDNISWDKVTRVEIYNDAEANGNVVEAVYADSQSQVDAFMNQVTLHNSDYIEISTNRTSFSAY